MPQPPQPSQAPQAPTQQQLRENAFRRPQEIRSNVINPPPDGGKDIVTSFNDGRPLVWFPRNSFKIFDIGQWHYAISAFISANYRLAHILYAEDHNQELEEKAIEGEVEYLKDVMARCVAAYEADEKRLLAAVQRSLMIEEHLQFYRNYLWELDCMRSCGKIGKVSYDGIMVHGRFVFMGGQFSNFIRAGKDYNFIRDWKKVPFSCEKKCEIEFEEVEEVAEVEEFEEVAEVEGFEEVEEVAEVVT